MKENNKHLTLCSV